MEAACRAVEICSVCAVVAVFVVAPFVTHYLLSFALTHTAAAASTLRLKHSTQNLSSLTVRGQFAVVCAAFVIKISADKNMEKNEDDETESDAVFCVQSM